MRQTVTRGWWLGSAFLVACGSQQQRPAAPDYAKTRAAYDTATRRVTRSLAYVAAPLKSLTEEQKASLAALLTITRVVAQTEVSGLGTPEVTAQLWSEVERFCPVPKAVDFKYSNCLDEQIAYASAMKKCEDEGKSEDECEREAAGEAAAAIACEMRKLEEMRGAIQGIPGRRWPPRPFPWPITGPTP